MVLDVYYFLLWHAQIVPQMKQVHPISVPDTNVANIAMSAVAGFVAIPYNKVPQGIIKMPPTRKRAPAATLVLMLTPSQVIYIQKI